MMLISFFKRLFFPRSYYVNRLEALHNRFLEETKKDKLLASFAKFLLPTHKNFEINGVPDNNSLEDNKRWVVVDKYQFKEIYQMGIKYYMGMRIFWT